MVGWTRGRLLVAVGLALVVGAIGWAYLIPSGEREEALVLPGFVLGLAGLLVSVIPLVAQLGRPGAVRSVTVLADELAKAVGNEWRTEATHRRLQPEPIPLRWSLSDQPVAGSLAAAIGTPGASPAFEPLPGYIPIAETYLQAGGGRSELYAVYAGLASGRIVVVGAPGAGKSGTAILLLLDALTHRRELDNNPQQQARMPVPVLFTARSWDPTSTSIQNWLADRLAVNYPMFAHRGGRAEAAALIAARDKVTLLLDGLDEMDTDLLPAALEALSDATFRVVVLTRSKEMVQAASKKRLTGAIAVHLHGLTAAEAVDYLQHADLPQAGWDTLLTHLRDHPDGAVARALSTPLTLTLLRDTYQPSDNVRELIDLAHTRPPAAIEQHLIDRVLPAAYTPRPGRPKPRYTEHQACQTLSFLARQMEKTESDLDWWDITQWVPSTPRLLATGLVSALLGGLGLGLANGVKDGLEHGFETGLAAGLSFGLAGALVGMAFGLTFGYIPGRSGGMPQRLKNWRDASLRLTLHSVIVGAITGWITVSFVGFIASGLRYGFMIGLAVGLPCGVVGGLVFGLLFKNTSPGSEDRPREPRESWRNDRIFRLSGAPIGGLAGGLCAGLGGQFADGIVPAGVLVTGLWAGSAFGLTVGIPVGLMVTLVFSQSWATTLAWLQLRWSHRIPVISLIPFLEDARERDVLRTAGMSYQFRHATLQDRLVSQSPQTPRHPPRFRLHQRHGTETGSPRISVLSGEHDLDRRVS